MAKTDAEIKSRLKHRDDERNRSKAKFSQLLPYIFEHKKVLSVVLVLSILGAAASLVQPLMVSQVVGVVEAGETLGNLVWVLVAIVVVGALLSSFEHYLLQRTGEGIVLSSRKHLVQRMLRLPIAEFDQRRTGDLVSRVGSDTTLLRAVLTQGLVEAVGGAVTFVGAVIAMLIIDPVLLGLTVLVVAIAGVTVVLMSLKIRTASRIAQERVGDLAASVERAVSAIRTVRASNATEKEINNISQDAKGAWAAGITVAKISALIMPIAGIAMQVSFLVVLGVGGFRVASGVIGVGDLVAFIMFLFMMIMPLAQAFGAFTAVNQALGALGRIQEIIQIPSETENDETVIPADSNPDLSAGPANSAEQKSSSAAAGAKQSQLQAENSVTVPKVSAKQLAVQELGAELKNSETAIEFSEVVFSYPEESHKTETEKIIAASLAEAKQSNTASIALNPEAEATQTTERKIILDGVSFKVKTGQRTALVGPSGAGKSTVLSLVERFYDPDSGSIKIAGRQLAAVDREVLRAQIGFVEQDAPVLAGTIRDNLLLAAPHASDEDCRQVLAEVNLTAVLDRNPLGLDAQVGEDGIMLSGGERQRLAIARTLLAAAPILLLDESTSSLDGLNEQMLKEAIDRASENRTLIVIAHRLSTVIDSEQIIVLDKGKVVGTGTHAELMVSTPLYRELAERQLLS